MSASKAALIQLSSVTYTTNIIYTFIYIRWLRYLICVFEAFQQAQLLLSASLCQSCLCRLTTNELSSFQLSKARVFRAVFLVNESSRGKRVYRRALAQGDVLPNTHTSNTQKYSCLLSRKYKQALIGYIPCCSPGRVNQLLPLIFSCSIKSSYLIAGQERAVRCDGLVIH